MYVDSYTKMYYALAYTDTLEPHFLSISLLDVECELLASYLAEMWEFIVVEIL